jgi:PTS system nitrogen regulatory IIA component
LGHGVAIPHGRIKGLKAPMAAVLQLATPIGFDAPDEQAVGSADLSCWCPRLPPRNTSKFCRKLPSCSATPHYEKKCQCRVDEGLHGLIADWHLAIV